MSSEKFDLSGEPLIYLITDGTATAENFVQKKKKIFELAAAAVQTKIAFVQIREKQLPARLVYELASETARLTQNTFTRLLVNDRADIALAAEADGVHLTAKSIAADVIKRNFPENFIVGASAHSVEAAENARRQGADFVTFSPIFFSPDKGDTQGIGILREVCERLDNFPVIALGGIDETNYADVLAAGARGFAAIRFLNDAETLKSLIANLPK